MRKRTQGKRGAAGAPHAAFTSLKHVLIFVFVVSGVVNVLALTGSFYMLQIYDRALTSQSVPTLLALSFLAIGLYLFQGVLDISRSQILVRIGARLDRALAPLAHKVAIDMPRFGFSTTEAMERGRDVDTLRSFMGGQGPIALFDLPWMPLYLAFIYYLHPWLGLLCLSGAIVLATLTVIAEILTKRYSSDAQRAAVARAAMADCHARHADIIHAMGFSRHAVNRYERLNADHLSLQTRTNDVAGTLSGISKVLRMILQSAVLGLGAYLTILGDFTAGAIIAASVASARALAPVDLAIAQWKNVVAARRSYKRLSETLSSIDTAPPLVALPPPKASLKVERVTIAAPGTGAVVLSDVSLELRAGQAAGIIGPSGGGKSTLARGLTGVWPLLRGDVRLDEAEIGQWPADQLGQHIGYLPQEVSLLDATISENISRLDPDADGKKILAAAKAAGVHEMIVRLPQGYETLIGPEGWSLSAGQRQRIALARALYGEPFLVILDEPNSNLDAEGEAALTAAVQSVRDRGGIVVVIAHRPSALAAVDMIGVIQQGKLAAFGRKEEIISRNSVQPPGQVPRDGKLRKPRSRPAA
jgi:ATP-binding cassette subfamily C protein